MVVLVIRWLPLFIFNKLKVCCVHVWCCFFFLNRNQQVEYCKDIYLRSLHNCKDESNVLLNCRRSLRLSLIKQSYWATLTTSHFKRMIFLDYSSNTSQRLLEMIVVFFFMFIVYVLSLSPYYSHCIIYSA